MKTLGVIERALGVSVMAWALVAGLPNVATAAPQAAVTTSVSSAAGDSSTQQFDQRYAERAEASESLQAFEGGQGAGIYVGGTTVVVVLLVVLLLVLL